MTLTRTSKGGIAKGYSDEEAEERIERMKQTHGVKDELRNMMVEIEELTRRFSAHLDAKSMRLEKLLDITEAKIKELEDLHAESDSRGNGVIGGATREEAVTPGEAAKPQPNDPKTAEIYALSDQGKSAHEIATTLEEHVGKVELILALRQ